MIVIVPRTHPPAAPLASRPSPRLASHPSGKEPNRRVGQGCKDKSGAARSFFSSFFSAGSSFFASSSSFGVATAGSFSFFCFFSLGA